MRAFFFTLIICLALSTLITQNAFAERGQNYDRSESIGPDGILHGNINFYTSNFTLASDGSYKPYIYTEDANTVQVESEQGSFIYDKNQCSMSFFDSSHIKSGQPAIIKSDSFVLKGAALNSNNWILVNAINSAACQTIVTKDGNNVKIDAIKSVPNVGTLKITWTKNFLQPLETILTVTNNNPIWVNNKIGVTETIQLPSLINLGNQTIDLSTRNNMKIDRAWILNHRALVSSISNKLNYDFRDAFPFFSNMTVQYSAGQASLAIDYLNSNKRVGVGESVSVDPLFGYNSGTNYQIVTGQVVSTSCGTPITKQSGQFNDITIPSSDLNQACTRMAYLFPINNLNGTVIDKTLLKLNVTAIANPTVFPPGNIGFSGLHVATNRAIWNFTLPDKVYTFSAGGGGIKIQATILSEEKNYTFYRTGSLALFNLTMTHINNYNTNFTINNSPVSGTTLNVTGSNVLNLYLDGTITNINKHYTGGVNVLTIGNARNVEVEYSQPNTSTSRVCTINSVNDNPSVSSPATIWNDIGSGTTLASNITACQTLVTNAVIDLGNNGVSYIQNRVNNAVSNNWATIGIKDTNETRTGQTSSTTFGTSSVQLAVSYHGPTPSTPSAPLNVVATGGVNKNTITYTVPNFKGSSAITNYNLYRSTFPFAQQSLPVGSGTDSNTNYAQFMNMSGNTILQQFEGLNKNNYNDTSGHKENIIRIPNPSLTNDLKANWKFDESSGIVYNKASFGNYTISLSHNADATPTGAISYSQAGKVKTSVSLNGAAQYFTTGTSLSQYNFMNNPDSNWSFTTWYKRPHTLGLSNDMVFFTASTGANNGVYLQLFNSTGEARFRLFESGNMICNSAIGFFPNDGNFHFFQITANTTSGNVTNNYHYSLDNGAISACSLGGNPLNGLSGNVGHIGTTGGLIQDWVGNLDEMSIWNRMLTQSEITKLYNNGKGLSPYSSPSIKSEGKFGQGGLFDGNYTAMNFTSTRMPQGTNPFTILAWDYFNDTSKPLNLMGFKTSTDRSYIQVNGTHGSIYSNNQFLVQCSQTRTTGHWNFDAFTYDGVTAKYYSNGTLSCSAGSALGLGSPSNNNYTIGIDPLTNKRIFNGTLDDYAIFNRVLSPTEITNAWMRGNMSFNLIKEVGNVTSIVDSGLGNGTNFFYRVQAINGGGNGTISNTANSTTASLPSKPLQLIVQTVSNNRNDLSCVPGSNGGNPITGYQVLRNGTMLINSTSALCTLYTDQPINVFKVQNYSVAAWNSVGRGQFISVLSSGVGPSIPSPVSDLQATSITDTEVDLAWSQPNLNGGTFLGYQINYTTPHSTPKTVIVNNTLSANTAYVVTGLTKSTDYSFRVGIWTKNSGNALGNILDITTTQGFIPANFTAGFLNVTGSNPVLPAITFTRTDPSPTQTILTVKYPSSYNLACTFKYTFAQTNKTYSNLVKQNLGGGLSSTPFTLTNSSNDVIYTTCQDAATGNKGSYVLTAAYGSIPLIQQIKDFQAGKFGTTGQFGLIDIVTLLALIISMIGLNRVNETLGVVMMVMVIGGLAVFGIISWPVIITAAVALVLLVTVTTTRKLAYS